MNEPDAAPVDERLDGHDAFIAQTLAAIRAESAAEMDAQLQEALSAMPRPGAAPRRPRRPWLGTALIALAAGLVGAALSFAMSRPGEPVSSPMPGDEAFALDGGATATRAPITIARDAEGRPTEIARKVGEGSDARLDGERVLFRAGQVIRIEHYKDGKLDGPQLDFDGLGRLVAMRTFAAGVERGPFVELAPDGSVTASGVR